MATSANTPSRYNFRCRQPALAARLASLRTQDIEAIWRHCFGSTVNIMQKFTKPPKCKACEYIIDNAPSAVLQQILAQSLEGYETAANNPQGRPVNKYRHDPNASNIQQRTNAIEIEAVPTDVQAAIDAANADTDADAASAADALEQAFNEVTQADEVQAQAHTATDEHIREIARQEDAKVATFVERAIAEAIAKIQKPNVIHIATTNGDGETQTRDMGLQHYNFARLLGYCQQRDRAGNRSNVWLPGPAGSGKTTAAENVAQALGLAYGYMGAMMDKTEAFGYMDAHGNYVETEFYRRWTQGGVFLWDEADGSDAQQAVTMNAALAGAWAAFPHGMFKRHADFVFIAAANTYGHGGDAKYVGRNPLDKATLDRFIKLAWGYDENLERMIIGDDKWYDYTKKFRAAVERYGYDVVVSTRAGQRCVMMANAGNDTDKEIIETVFRDGMTSDQWAQVSRGII